MIEDMGVDEDVSAEPIAPSVLDTAGETAPEPIAPAEPVAAAAAPQAVAWQAPAQPDLVSPAVHEEIEALRAEIAALRAMQNHASYAAPTVDPEALKGCFALIEERLSGLEFRVEEQDAALRRVLTLLVDWVERDERAADPERNAA